MKRKIFLALGGNIGEVSQRFEDALAYLQAHGVTDIRRSSCAVTTPVDCACGTPDFYNMAVEASTGLEVEELLKLTQQTEVLFGRPAEHGFHESRTLDIDIIYMENVFRKGRRLEVPHPRAYERDFVMRFLSELDCNAAEKVTPCKMLSPCPAPMEGVMTDALIKTAFEEKLCDNFVTPFLRISEHIPKEKEIRKFLAPYENTQVTLQLMGNSPVMLAETAAAALKFEISGINLNFGCPSGQVLRHRGGGALLKEPQTMRKICRAIRQSCPDLLLSVKMRMGFENAGECLEYLPEWSADKNDAPDFFIVHSRSVREGYIPLPEQIHTERSRAFVSSVSQKVMLNGDIENPQQAIRRMQLSGGTSFMSGRSWLKDPWLFCKFEADDCSETTFEKKKYFYLKVLENAEKLGAPYPVGKQIELSQLMFAPENPFFDFLRK